MQHERRRCGCDLGDVDLAVRRANQPFRRRGPWWSLVVHPASPAIYEHHIDSVVIMMQVSF
jgi:hypothetical protein